MLPTALFRRGFLVLSLAFSASWASAQIIVSNWNISGNTLTFDIAGTIQSGVTIGPFDQIRLYIGVPGDTDWVDAASPFGTETEFGGIDLNYSLYSSSADGDYVQILKDDTSNWQIGDTVNASIMITGGTLIGANINPLDIIVSAGSGVASPVQLPHTLHQVGSYSAVPEPSTFAGIAGVFALLGAGFRRRRS